MTLLSEHSAEQIGEAFSGDDRRIIAGMLSSVCWPEGMATYHWSLMQGEYATNPILHRQADLRSLDGALVRPAIHAIKPDHVPTFLGRKLTGNDRDELGNDVPTRIQGACLEHQMAPVAIQLSDQQAPVLRIEKTATDVSFCLHHRTGEHEDRTTETKLVPLSKTIDRLALRRESLVAAASPSCRT